MSAEGNGMKSATTVTVSTDPTSSQSLEIRLNIGYFTTIPGIIKLVQLILGVICMACASPAKGIPLKQRDELSGLGENHFFLFVVVTCFIVTLIWTFFYLLQIREFIKIKLPFTFLWIEVLYTVIATAFYVIAFIVLLSGFGGCTDRSTECGARVAGGVFAIFNSIAYGLGAVLIYQEYNATPPELQ